MPPLPNTMNTVAFYDTKPYDRESFERAPEASRLRRQFHEFRLTSETAASADGAQAVCVFVNDRLDAPCLEQLHQAGVRLVAIAHDERTENQAARRIIRNRTEL